MNLNATLGFATGATLFGFSFLTTGHPIPAVILLLGIATPTWWYLATHRTTTRKAHH